MQWLTSQLHVPLPPFTTSKDFTVTSSFRLKAGSVLESAIDKNDYPDIGWDWIGDKKTAPPLSGEWLAGEDEPGEKRNESVVLYVHGGAGYMGSTMTHRLLTSSIAKASGFVTFKCRITKITNTSLFVRQLVDGFVPSIND